MASVRPEKPPRLHPVSVEDRSNVELARASGSGNDRWRGMPAHPDSPLLPHDQPPPSASHAFVDVVGSSEPLTAASLPAGLVATPASVPAAMVAELAGHDLEPTATLARTAVADMPSLPAVPVSAMVPDEELIRGTLTQFRTAYSQLDVKAARQVWPSVDARALERAFEGLKKQALLFDRCDLAVNGAEASAACSGRATYVPRVGSSAARTDRREWNFQLKKVDESWTIASANAR